jgi:hypothetical protein
MAYTGCMRPGTFIMIMLFIVLPVLYGLCNDPDEDTSVLDHTYYYEY